MLVDDRWSPEAEASLRVAALTGRRLHGTEPHMDQVRAWHALGLCVMTRRRLRGAGCLLLLALTGCMALRGEEHESTLRMALDYCACLLSASADDAERGAAAARAHRILTAILPYASARWRGPARRTHPAWRELVAYLADARAVLHVESASAVRDVK